MCRRSVLATLGFLASVAALHAEPTQKSLSFSSEPIWTSGSRNSGGDGNARWLDADKDGDLDLVTSLPNPRRWVLFPNNDGRLAKLPVWESLETTDCDHISVLDYDGDGWMDLAGTHESHCTIYINQAGKTPKPFTSKPNWETGLYTDANQIDFGDFDQDGNVDMLMASGLPVFSVALFRAKDGKPSRTVSDTVGLREYSESSIFADFDSDGDLDIIATYGKLGTVYVYKNDGGSFDNGTLLFRDEAVPWCQRVYCIDLNKDGTKELFCARGPWGPAGASVALAQRPGSDKLQVIWKSDAKSGFHGFDFRDVDEDGDLDVAAADWGGRRVAIYLQEDGILSASPAWSARTTGPAHEVMFGDLDGDGDLDLAVGGVDQAQVFENRSESLDD